MAKTILKNKEKLEKIFAKHITDQALIFVFIKFYPYHHLKESNMEVTL